MSHLNVHRSHNLQQDMTAKAREMRKKVAKIVVVAPVIFQIVILKNVVARSLSTRIAYLDQHSARSAATTRAILPSSVGRCAPTLAAACAAKVGRPACSAGTVRLLRQKKDVLVSSMTKQAECEYPAHHLHLHRQTPFGQNPWENLNRWQWSEKCQKWCVNFIKDWHCSWKACSGCPDC